MARLIRVRCFNVKTYNKTKNSRKLDFIFDKIKTY